MRFWIFVIILLLGDQGDIGDFDHERYFEIFEYYENKDIWDV